jgi:hypothetical protein
MKEWISMKRFKNIVITFLSPILVWIFPIFFLYAQNVKEVAFIETMKSGGIFIALSLFFVFLGRVLFKNWEISGVYSAVNGVFLGNFSLILKAIQVIIPKIRYWHLLTFVLIISIVIGSFLLYKKSFTKDILLIFTFTCGALVLFNLAISMPTVIKKVNALHQSRENKLEENVVDKDAKSNIYYLVCDEYASFAQLEKDFGYDNAEFKNRLKNLGFNISEDSYNDCSSTYVVLANIMSLDYVATTSSTSVELEQFSKNGALHDILKNNGYTVRGIGDTGWLGIEGTLDTGSGATTSEGGDFTQLALEKSFIGALIKKNYTGEIQVIKKTLEQINEIEITPNSSIFTMFYVHAPHHPYYFKSDGSLNSPYKYTNPDGKNNESYIGQLEYVNRKVSTALERIIEKDPNSIIVLCSDHGNRFGNITENMETRILNVIYYKGRTTEDVKGLSGINTLRYIFNQELDMKLPYIELPK